MQAMPRISIFNPDVLWNGFGPEIHFVTLSARQAEARPPLLRQQCTCQEMARPGCRTAYKGKEARAGYLVGLPVSTGATQGVTELGWG